jgi:acyl transferase domain-containing protein
MGHAEAASGAASLAKILLMLRHKTIPANISLKTLNPLIAPLESDGTVISTSSVAWKSAGYSRTAVLNNFGAAGSNCALIVQEAAQSPRVSQRSSVVSSLPFGLSAKTEEAAERLRQAYLNYLHDKAHEDIDFADLAYTATARRQQFPYRISVFASNKAELYEKLAGASVAASPPPGGKVVFVFSGQGSQYAGMGSDLYRTSDLFRDIVDECHNKLVSSSLPGILGIIKGNVKSGEPDNQWCWQSATFVLEYALARLWISWGIKPDAVTGHRYSSSLCCAYMLLLTCYPSLGEYAALVIAGVIRIDDALMLVNRRSRLVAEHCTPASTGMMAIQLASVDTESLLRGNTAYLSLSVACYNRYGLMWI